MTHIPHYRCPYCGEAIDLQLDEGDDATQYIDDCPVCCRPIQVQLQRDDDGRASLHLRAEDE